MVVIGWRVFDIGRPMFRLELRTTFYLRLYADGCAVKFFALGCGLNYMSFVLMQLSDSVAFGLPVAVREGFFHVYEGLCHHISAFPYVYPLYVDLEMKFVSCSVASMAAPLSGMIQATLITTKPNRRDDVWRNFYA